MTGLVEFGDPYYYVVRQMVWAAGGAVLMFGMARTDYRRLRPLAVPIMTVTIALLVAVLVIGISGGGARRWIGVGELTIQPAEFAKLSVIIYLAAWLASKGDSVRSFEHGLLPFVAIIGSVSVLIMLQPNLGTTLIILVITVTMFYVAGASIAQMTALAVTGFASLAFLATAADTAPTRLGLIATLAFLGLYMLLMIRGFQVARRARDDFGQLIATGITTWITVQALLNIGGITRTIPLTGVPLPFFSFGSNALASVLLAIGVLLSISRFGTDRGGYFEKHPVDTRRVVRRRPDA
ncbi:MAG: FtsW/RodA/SpoVE family cell cycle protein [Dehalococcoidia bacterium]|nr:FtsW/RodA/SpoVE family cell cycle protein [Dehalococcoidia bacterium]